MTDRLLYLFNPDNDLALANGSENYMAPASARQMATELALLPVWFARPGSAVLASSAYNLAFLREMQNRLPIEIDLLTEPEVRTLPGLRPVPWGWNRALRRRLAEWGIPEKRLLSAEEIGEWCRLSHRSQAVSLLERLKPDSWFCGESFYLKSEEACRQFVEGWQACLLKAPLSGSGKGLNWCKGVFTPHISGWCCRIIKGQGGVVGEPIYNKAEDFAMEFLSDGAGKVCFAGYSLFRTGSSGAYEGNWLLPDCEIERRLSVYVPAEELRLLRGELEKQLSGLVGTTYTGYLGIDMMICRFESAPVYRIHPCVEINLRMNMGLVARLLYDRYVVNGSCGQFIITCDREAGAALREHERMCREYPLQIVEGRVVSGYLPLVPVHKGSYYRAYCLIGECISC